MTLQLHLKNLQKIMRLQDWDIDLVEHPTDYDGYNSLVYNDYKCIIHINIQLNETEKIKTLIHELVHVILRNSQLIATDIVEDKDVKTIFNREVERENEKLAKAIFNLYEKCGYIK